MKKTVLSLFVLINTSLFSGGKPNPASISGDYIVHQTGSHSYTVIYVNQGNRSNRESRKMAMRKAAEVGHENGYSYFTVNERENVVVGRSGRREQPPKNIYQEMIVEKNFGRDTLDDSYEDQPSGMFKGYKIRVQYFYDNPPSGAYRICKIIKC